MGLCMVLCACVCVHACMHAYMCSGCVVLECLDCWESCLYFPNHTQVCIRVSILQLSLHQYCTIISLYFKMKIRGVNFS